MSRHLTEEEINELADETMPVEQRLALAGHCETCDVCAAAVERLAMLVNDVRDVAGLPMPGDDLWPSIRSRIEQTKVVSLASDSSRPGPSSTADRPASPRSSRRLGLWIGGLAAVAAATAAFLVIESRNDAHPGARNSPAVASSDDSAFALVAIVDSAHAYEQEAQELLNKIELQRAMLRPDAVAAMERDLKVVDVAIAELKDAVARDPNNRALRQLLASSYRQKVDLLKRVSNAG